MKGSRYRAILRETFVVRKSRSISHVEVGPWSKQGCERLATSRPPGRRIRADSRIGFSTSSISMKAMLQATTSKPASSSMWRSAASSNVSDDSKEGRIDEGPMPQVPGIALLRVVPFRHPGPRLDSHGDVEVQGSNKCAGLEGSLCS